MTRKSANTITTAPRVFSFSMNPTAQYYPGKAREEESRSAAAQPHSFSYTGAHQVSKEGPMSGARFPRMSLPGDSVNRGKARLLERSLRAQAHRPTAYVHEKLPAVVQRGGADESR